MPEGPPTFRPHVSPDGAWQWDGHAWVPAHPPEPPPQNPVETPVPPLTDPATQHAPVRPPAPAPAATAIAVAERTPVAAGKENGPQEEARAEVAANRFGWLMIGALIGISLLVIAGIIGAALLIYRAAGSPPPNGSATPTPSARPDPGTLGYRYLAGLSVGGLTASLGQEGFRCAAPPPPESNLRDWRCDRTEGDQHEIVQVWAVDPTHVHLVEATTVAVSGSVDGAAVSRFEAEIVDLVYAASPKDVAAVKAWVDANGERTASTTIGAVTLRTQDTAVATLLDFDAGTRH